MNTNRRAIPVAVLVGLFGAAGAAQAAGGFGGPEYYAGVFAGSVSGKGQAHYAFGPATNVPRLRKGTWGLLGGVTFRNGPWLLGVEADASLGAKREAPRVGGPNPCTYYVCDVKSNWHVRGRFGYRVNKVDLFVTAGYSALRLSVEDDSPSIGHVSSGTLHGRNIGAGADFTVTRHGVLRLEVLRDKYDGKEIGSGTGYGVNNWKDTTVRAAAIFTF